MRPARLKHLAAIAYGLGQPPRLSDTGVPILRATNVERGKINPSDLIFAALTDLPLKRAPLLIAGEILVVRSGAYTGDSALVTDEWAGAAPGYDLRVTPRAIDARFLAYQMLARPFLDQIDLAKARAAQPHLNAEDLGNIKVVSTSPTIERATADYLDAETARIDALIGARNRQVHLLTERARTMVSERLHAHASDRVPVRRLATAVTSGPRGWSALEVDASSQVFLRIANVPADSIQLKLEDVAYINAPAGKESDRCRVRPGDVLTTITAAIGQVAVVPADVGEAYVSQHLALVRPDLSLVTPDWLALALWSHDSQRQLDAARYGGTKQQLSLDDVRAVQVPIGTIAAQCAAVPPVLNSLETTTRAVQLIRHSIVLLRERRQALIAAGVTGRLAIPHLAA